MKIAIVSSPGDTFRQLSDMLNGSLPDCELICCDLDSLRRQPLPREIAAAFVFVKDMHGLVVLRAMTGLYPATPVTVISKNPDFALEAIRQGARDYLLFPVVYEELSRAIGRMGLKNAQ
ncbi:hypothetical protein LJC56_05640 [Christensenellaceae bacterium OttesenSCG-928-K19]|nr:hypothetical protein [Christensenellaceae bacterium OttesenSCG-928-K19]